ncbi:hypothetical protein AVEN_216338-1 [Araneus ventricosus]|uniref:ATP-dependent DNA helicase n=1 Tax=Araneus ventricosus TaxID=182803 RepID=A0A4Y2PWL4_ARAVE|nr:hypothetical protein AVEN_216338-1 [Araneus ventricosus]
MEEQSKANANIEKLNSEQRYAVYKVLHAIYEYQTDMPKCFFLDGPAGTGKTFVYSTLLHAVRGKGDQAIAVASTGIAATLLTGGRTAHSIFKIPLTLNVTSTCNLKPNTSEAKILLDAKVIVWDEAPMTHVHAFLAVDRLLKDLTKCDEPFGGKIILLGGDFRQVLPVILRGSRSLTVSGCIKKHRLWSDFFVMKLTENMRAFDSEKEFLSWLLHVDEGESGEKIQLPPFCYPEIQDPVQQLFSDIDFKTVTPEELKGRAILTVTNDLSMQINNRVLECIPGNEVIYESIDNIVSNDPQDQLAYTEEFLNSLTPTGMPPHKLRLKPGAIIMLLRNLAPSKDQPEDIRPSLDLTCARPVYTVTLPCNRILLPRGRGGTPTRTWWLYHEDVVALPRGRGGSTTRTWWHSHDGVMALPRGRDGTPTRPPRPISYNRANENFK